MWLFFLAGKHESVRIPSERLARQFPAGCKKQNTGFVAHVPWAEQGKPVQVRRRRATVMCSRLCQNAIAERREGGSAAHSQETYKALIPIRGRENLCDPTDEGRSAHIGGIGLRKDKTRKYSDARAWVNKQLDARTNAALAERNQAFAVLHAQDGDEQLLGYLCRCAKELGKSPCMDEVIGGKYIAGRFGGWVQAVIAAGLPAPTKKTAPNGRKIYRDELKRQAGLYRRQQEQRREDRKRADQEKAERVRSEKQSRRERDMRWGAEHPDLSYDGLAAYLRKCAAEMGRSPYSGDVVGGEYIRKYFGAWVLALSYANLPIPAGVKAPTAAQERELQARINRCKPAKSPEAYTIE